MTSIGRRPLLLGAAALAGAALLPGRLALAAAPPQDRLFDVYRKGDKIGTHKIAFREGGGGFTATTEIRLAVKVAFIVAYRYEQTGDDLWVDGTLVRSRVATNDDGKKTDVSVERRGDRLAGQGPKGAIDLTLGDMTDLCWYRPEIMRRQQVLDAQNGAVNTLGRQGPQKETIQVGGRSLTATRYEVAAGPQSGSIWYDEQGNWTKGVLRTKGEELEYRLVG